MSDALPMDVGDGRTRMGKVEVAISDWTAAMAAMPDSRKATEG